MGFFFNHHSFAQLAGHCLNIARRQTRFSRNLFIGEVQAHEVQAQHPDAQRAMMPFTNRSSQIVKLLTTHLTNVALPVLIPIMMSAFLDLVRIAFWTAKPIRPAQLAHHLVTLRIVNQLFNSYHPGILPHHFLQDALNYRKSQNAL